MCAMAHEVDKCDRNAPPPRVEVITSVVRWAPLAGCREDPAHRGDDAAGDVGVLRGPTSWRCPKSAIQLATRSARRWPAGEFLGASPSSRRDERHKLSLSTGASIGQSDICEDHHIPWLQGAVASP